jgi:hypothetical protein
VGAMPALILVQRHRACASGLQTRAWSREQYLRGCALILAVPRRGERGCPLVGIVGAKQKGGGNRGQKRILAAGSTADRDGSPRSMQPTS